MIPIFVEHLNQEYFSWIIIPANIYLFKVSNRKTSKESEIFSKFDSDMISISAYCKVTKFRGYLNSFLEFTWIQFCGWPKEVHFAGIKFREWIQIKKILETNFQSFLKTFQNFVSNKTGGGI